MKVGDLVKITPLGERNIEDPRISKGDKAIVLKVCKGGWAKYEFLYKIVMIKDGYMIENLDAKEIKKLNKTKQPNV